MIRQLQRSLHYTSTVEAVRAYREVHRGKKLGLVPTMGALHMAHMQLVKEAKKECDKVMVSIFVNPTQFAPHEDFNAYPRPLQHDLDLLSREGADAVFVPSRKELYGSDKAGLSAGKTEISPELDAFQTYVVLQGADKLIEGQSRPGFFRGVATVVVKLLNIAQPNFAYFGQKDGAQCIVLRRVVSELNIPTTVRIIPTLRDPDGLAMSSRNVYLSPAERAASPIIYKSLKSAEGLYLSGERNTAVIRAAVNAVLKQEPLVDVVQYVNVCDNLTGRDYADSDLLPDYDRPNNHGAMVSIALRMGKTRLIDNIILGTNL